MPNALPSFMCLGLVAVLLGAANLAGQERVQIPPHKVCAGCRISVTRVARLGGATDPGSVARSPSVALDSRGRFIVGPTYDGAQLLVYDRTGRFLRVVGRRGKGPGEFQRISHVTVSAGDTLHVFDAVNLRHTVLSPDFHTVRMSPIPGRVYAAFTGTDGTTLIQAPARTSDRFGFPLHLVDPRGRILRSFGSLQATYQAGDVDAEFRPVAAAAPTATWVGHVGRYELGLWDNQGRLIRTMVRNPDWFRPRQEQTRRDPFTERPRPWIADIHQDPAGRLWVVIGTASSRWKRADGNPRGERRPLSVTEGDRFFDTVLEVIDPRTGELLASARNAGPPLQFFSGNLAFRPREDENGNPYLDVMRVQVNDPAERRPY